MGWREGDTAFFGEGAEKLPTAKHLPKERKDWHKQPNATNHGTH